MSRKTKVANITQSVICITDSSRLFKETIVHNQTTKFPCHISIFNLW